jgi:tRNA A37 threonylcarbamoyladenosine biosynthesis protein TsaE
MNTDLLGCCPGTFTKVMMIEWPDIIQKIFKELNITVNNDMFLNPSENKQKSR